MLYSLGFTPGEAARPRKPKAAVRMRAKAICVPAPIRLEFGIRSETLWLLATSTLHFAHNLTKIV
jgi:hypothetical protein